MSAVFKHLGKENGSAALIEKVKGYDIPVAGSLFGKRSRLALTLETDGNTLVEEHKNRKQSRIPLKIVQEAPVKQVVLKGE